MRLLRRRRSRRQRVANQIKNLRKRAPSAPELPSIELPEMPRLPSAPDIDVRQRLSRDTGTESPALSLAGGLLLGLLVGIVVAVILIARNDGEEASMARQTGITLLPHHEGEGESPEKASSAGTA